jgi:hypothetical protein
MNAVVNPILTAIIICTLIDKGSDSGSRTIAFRRRKNWVSVKMDTPLGNC